MKKTIFWILALFMAAFAVTYLVTNNETAMVCCMIFGAAAISYRWAGAGNEISK